MTAEPLAVDESEHRSAGPAPFMGRDLLRRCLRCSAVVLGALLGAVGLVLLPLLGSFGDLVALALPVGAIGLALLASGCLLVRRARLVGMLAAGLCLSTAFGVVVPRLPQATAAPLQPLRISAVNVRFDNPTPAEVVRSALASKPDVLIVSELTAGTDRLLTSAFPYRLVRDDLLSRESFAEGVYSKVPLQLITTPALPGQSLRVRIAAPRPFVLYAIHLPRPVLDYHGGHMTTSVGRQRSQVEALDRAVDAETDPVVIAGDLNLSDRTRGYATLHHRRVDAIRSGWAGTTYVGSFSWDLLMLRIDHVFIPADWCATGAGTFALQGSDHRGVQAQIGRCR